MSGAVREWGSVQEVSGERWGREGVDGADSMPVPPAWRASAEPFRESFRGLAPGVGGASKILFLKCGLRAWGVGCLERKPPPSMPLPQHPLQTTEGLRSEDSAGPGRGQVCSSEQSSHGGMGL